MGVRADPWWGLKVRAHQALRLAEWARQWPQFARRRAADSGAFPHLLFAHRSLLCRGDDPLERGKLHNVAIGMRRLDNLLHAPGQVFSVCLLLGPITRRRGYVDGWELYADRLAPGVGGGLCALANMTYWLALNTGMTVLERHRHEYDLFPDHGRTVPFGAGATIYWNYVDLQLSHRLPGAVRWRFAIEGDTLVGEVWGEQPLPAPVRVYETEHRIAREGGVRWRMNKLWRQIGEQTELLAENRCRCLY